MGLYTFGAAADAASDAFQEMLTRRDLAREREREYQLRAREQEQEQAYRQQALQQNEELKRIALQERQARSAEAAENMRRDDFLGRVVPGYVKGQAIAPEHVEMFRKYNPSLVTVARRQTPQGVSEEVAFAGSQKERALADARRRIETDDSLSPAQRKEALLLYDANGELPANFFDPDRNLSYEDKARIQHKYSSANGGPNTPLTPVQKFRETRQMQQDWLKISGAANETNRQLQVMEAGLKQAETGNLAAGSQAVLVTFQKILDPTSVVRESEYARSANNQSLYNRVTGLVERMQKGGAGVPLPELKKYVEAARAIAGEVGETRSSIHNMLESMALDSGLNPKHIFPDYGVKQPTPAPDAALTSDDAYSRLQKRLSGGVAIRPRR